MGRRSINTTKSGKYMNPTDQARKEARKLELKKNKKQRQMVRAAVLKGKDPMQILEEMEKIDQMEYNVYQPSPLNEKVLKDKRKKLRDTLERVLNMYHRDDPDKWAELKRAQSEYEHKKNQIVAFYESVKSAQQVSVDEIPLPQMPEQPSSNTASQIPLPAEIRKPEHTIYSIATALKLQALGQPMKEPPGCPPGPPPDINSDGEEVEYAKELARNLIEQNSESEGLNQESLITDENSDSITVKPSSVQQKMVAISGQNIDEFMKEMEVVHKKKENDKDEESRTKGPTNLEPLVPPGTDPVPQLQSHPQVPTGPPPLLFSGPTHLRLPPGPPPGRPLMPPGPPPGMPPPRLPIRMPPAPPRLMRIPGPPPNIPAPPNLPIGTPNVLTAGPQLINRSEPIKHGATIMAKPQIRNLSADVTRFVPSTLRVKREDKKAKSNTRALVNELKHKEMIAHAIATGHQPTKDDAYMQFMKEMQGLL